MTFSYATGLWRNTDSVVAGGRRTAFRYDRYGRDSLTTDPDGHTGTTLYDLVNRRTRAIGPIGDATIFTYDGLFLTQVQDAIGQTYGFSSNALGWVTTRTDPRGKRDSLQYDRSGNLRRSVNRRGQATLYDTYDGLNRLLHYKTVADGQNYTLRYDAHDRWVSSSDAASTDTLQFDVAGRPTGQITVRGGTRYVLSATVNVRDLPTQLQITTPWTASIGYHYTASMLLDSLTNVAGARTGIGYNGDQQPTTYTTPVQTMTRGYPSTHTPYQVTFNNVTINNTIGTYYSYTSRGQVADRGEADGSGGREYSYDAAGRLTKCRPYTWQGTNCDWYCDPYAGCRWQCATQSKSYSADSLTFAYDSVGNRKDTGAQITTGNRLVKFNGDSLLYDDDGNLTRRIRSGSDYQRLYWNTLGQLLAVWTSGRDSVTFTYDALGRRASKQVNSGATRRYLWAGEDLFAEVDAGTGNRLAEYSSYPGLDRPASVRVGGATGTTYYLAQDFPGNVIGLLNASGLAATHDYAPYGASDTSVSLSALKFAGREYDRETGLYYVRARYYDPNIGRFVSEDPLGLAGGINTYAYAGDDAVNRRDPTGLCPVCAVVGWGLFWGGVYVVIDVVVLGHEFEWPHFGIEMTLGMMTGGLAEAAINAAALSELEAAAIESEALTLDGGVAGAVVISGHRRLNPDIQHPETISGQAVRDVTDVQHRARRGARLPVIPGASTPPPQPQGWGPVSPPFDGLPLFAPMPHGLAIPGPIKTLCVLHENLDRCR